MATLYIFAGLPGSGKSTLAQALARRLGAAYLRIDTIEQGLKDLLDAQVHGEGYGLAYCLAAAKLRRSKRCCVRSVANSKIKSGDPPASPIGRPNLPFRS